MGIGAAVSGAIVAGLGSVGITGALATGLAYGTIGAGLGAGFSAATGGDPGMGALGGFLTGGAIGGFGGALGSALGSEVAGSALAGAAGGALSSGVTGSDPLIGTIGGAASGAFSGLLSGGSADGAGAAGSGGASAAGVGGGVPGGAPVDLTGGLDSIASANLAGETAGLGAGASPPIAGVTLQGPTFSGDISAPLGASAASPIATATDLGVGGGSVLNTGQGAPVFTGSGATPPTGSVPLAGDFSGGGLGGASPIPAGTPAGFDTIAATNLAGELGSGGNAIQSVLNPPASATAGGGMLDNLTGAVKANPISATLAGGGLLFSLMNPSASGKDISSLRGTSDQLSAQGRQLSSFLQSGTLPPGVQQSIDGATQAAKAAVRQSFAQRGLAGSTMEQQALQQVDMNAVNQTAQIGQQLLTTGINEQNIAAGLLQGVLTANTQQSQQTGNSIASLAAALSGTRPVQRAA